MHWLIVELLTKSKRERRLLKLERRLMGAEHSADRGDWAMTLICHDDALRLWRAMTASGAFTDAEIEAFMSERGLVRAMRDSRYHTALMFGVRDYRRAVEEGEAHWRAPPPLLPPSRRRTQATLTQE